MTNEHSGVSGELRRPSDHQPVTSTAAVDWDFPNLGGVWDWESRAIMAGARRLDGLAEADRARSVNLLGERVRTLAVGLDDGWLVAIPRYRNEGHHVADRLITRCHQEWRSSVYLNLDLDDDSPALPLDVALSQRGTPGSIVIFRNQSPYPGSVSQIVPPPGVRFPQPRQR